MFILQGQLEALVTKDCSYLILFDDPSLKCTEVPNYLMAVYNSTVSLNTLGSLEKLPSNGTYLGRSDFGDYGEELFYATTIDKNDPKDNIWIQ